MARQRVHPVVSCDGVSQAGYLAGGDRQLEGGPARHWCSLGPRTGKACGWVVCSMCSCKFLAHV